MRTDAKQSWRNIIASLIGHRAFVGCGVVLLFLATLIVAFVQIHNGPDRNAIREVTKHGGAFFSRDRRVPVMLADWINEWDSCALKRVRKVSFCQTDFLSKVKTSQDFSYTVPFTSDIGDPEIDELVPYLQRLTELHELEVSGTRITNEGLRQIGKLTRLTHLNLDGTIVDDAGLVHLSKLKNLESLSLWVTRISDDGLEQLYELDKLTFLDVRQTNVTAEGIHKLKMALPQLKVMWSDELHDNGE